MQCLLRRPYISDPRPYPDLQGKNRETLHLSAQALKTCSKTPSGLPRSSLKSSEGRIFSKNKPLKDLAKRLNSQDSLDIAVITVTPPNCSLNKNSLICRKGRTLVFFVERPTTPPENLEVSYLKQIWPAVHPSSRVFFSLW